MYRSRTFRWGLFPGLTHARTSIVEQPRRALAFQDGESLLAGEGDAHVATIGVARCRVGAFARELVVDGAHSQRGDDLVATCVLLAVEEAIGTPLGTRLTVGLALGRACVVLNKARDFSIQRVVAPTHHVFTGMPLGPALAEEDVGCADLGA